MDRIPESIDEIRCRTSTTGGGDDPSWSFRFKLDTLRRERQSGSGYFAKVPNYWAAQRLST